LSPVAIAVSTFLTKVRTRLIRARFTAVRFSVWRSRFSADLWWGIGTRDVREEGAYIGGARQRQPRRGEGWLSIFEGGLALADKGGHPLLLILGREGRME